MQDWYLMKSPTLSSGDESEPLSDYSDDALIELFATDVATNVEIYNSDLSNCKEARVLIQNKVPDTELKTLTRHMVAPIGTCKAGMYVKYDGRFWLVVGLVDSNVVYEKAILSICNHCLSWINSSGEIIQRWANIVSASQYNNGEKGNKYYFLRSDQLLVAMPDDDESVLLTNGARFIIDKRCKVYAKSFTEDIMSNTSKPVVTYTLTRADSVLYDYQDSGHTEFIATEDEKHDDDGYYVVNGKGVWLCGKPNIENQNAVLSSKIEFDSDIIYNGIEEGVFIAKFYNDGEEVEVLPQWTVDCDFANDLDVSYVDNAICISVNNKKLVNKSFGLSLSAAGYEPTSVVVTIKALM